jgi:DNA polymerase elongation subunit (family B)
MPYKKEGFVGKFYDEPKIKIKGFENQRSDSPPVTAELQEKIIEMILTNEDFVTVSKYIESVIEEIDIESDNVERFALPGSLNRDLEDYTNTQITRGARYSNEHLDKEFGEGDDPFVYMVDDTPAGLPQTDVVALEWDDDIPEGFELNKEAIIERGIKKPIDSIINEMDWEFNEIRSGKRQKKKDLSTGGSNPFA